MNPIGLLVHVEDIEKALYWYASAFIDAVLIELPLSGAKALKIGNFILEIVPSDNKVSSGETGTVLYWYVSNLQAEIVRFQNLGSTLHRGPMDIEGGLAMCQMTDTFGNLIGLRGPQ
ncbi:glyoxalase/bleomycin resistance/dioxygenase family protein [bacterium]|nr:glyoxalase/bleomycin resistance/dioxygenase family protein [bacterium]